jgi:hypothetical protein
VLCLFMSRRRFAGDKGMGLSLQTNGKSLIVVDVYVARSVTNGGILYVVSRQDLEIQQTEQTE